MNETGGKSPPGPITPARLAAALEPILGERHLQTSAGHHDAVGERIAATFAAHGWQVAEQLVPGPFGTGRNVRGRKAGGGPGPRRTWVLGAHYDTVRGTPGADDNGIAVAALLEAARVLARHRFRDDVELVAWDLEEQQTALSGALLGSRVMAREAAADPATRIAGVLDLEMIGLCRHEPGSQRFPPGFGLLFPAVVRTVRARGDRGDFLAAVADGRSRPLVDAVVRAADAAGLPLVPVVVEGMARAIPHFYRSDHASFWVRGIPAVMLTDTADFRSGHYHRPSDTADTLDLDFAARAARTAVGALVALAGVDGVQGVQGAHGADGPGRA